MCIDEQLKAAGFEVLHGHGRLLFGLEAGNTVKASDEHGSIYEIKRQGNEVNIKKVAEVGVAIYGVAIAPIG
jgi:hypothetical protein